MILQKAVSDDALKIMQDIASLLLQSMAQGPIVRETAFQTAVQAIGRDERKRFASRFLEEIERIAYDK